MKRTWLVALALGSVLLAQDSRGWRRIDPATPGNPSTDAPAPLPAPVPDAPPAPAAPPDPNWNAPAPADAYGQSSRAQMRPAPLPELPASLTIAPGTFVSVRIDQHLTTDHNLTGDSFTGTLLKPIVVDGVVVAERGQTIAGRVAESVKGGRVSGTSRMGLELTDLTLVDGQQIRIKSTLASYAAPTSNGRDAGAVATTTALGAGIGAVADGGFGAGVGAAAGAAAGVIGVLFTRGHPVEIYPESTLTFRMDAPVTISTTRAPQAFHFVDPHEYERAAQAPRFATRVQPRPPAYYAPYAYPYYWAPYPYWGPSIGFYYGPRWYGGGRYYYRGRRW